MEDTVQYQKKFFKRYFEKLKNQEYKVACPANTLIIANVHGFHKRGEGWKSINPPPPLSQSQKSSGLYEGYVRIPWNKNNEPYVGVPTTCFICSLKVKSGSWKSIKV